MKKIVSSYSLILTLGLLLASCTDSITGSDTYIPETMSTTFIDPASPVSDLSVLVNKQPLKTGRSIHPPDSFLLVINIHNAGPDVATGIMYSIESTTECRKGKKRGIGDDLIWDIVDQPIELGLTATVEATCAVEELGPAEATIEIVRSDSQDPDSTPGNGEPGEDDQTTVQLTLE